MSRISERVKVWRERTKKRIVDAFGGQCGICGYNRCQDALDLHHINPDEKDFSFGKMRANPKNWNAMVVELRKCCLLCSNCHREVHHGMTKISESIKKFNEDFSNYKRIELIDKTNTLTNKCPVCQKDKPIWYLTCSTDCGRKLNGKYDWSKIDLKDLYLVKKKNMSEIADIIGCSVSGVRKRLIAEKIYLTKVKSKLSIGP